MNKFLALIYAGLFSLNVFASFDLKSIISNANSVFNTATKIQYKKAHIAKPKTFKITPQTTINMVHDFLVKVLDEKNIVPAYTTVNLDKLIHASQFVYNNKPWYCGFWASCHCKEELLDLEFFSLSLGNTSEMIRFPTLTEAIGNNFALFKSFGLAFDESCFENNRPNVGGFPHQIAAWVNATYKKTNDFKNLLAEIKQSVDSDKPLMVTLFGEDTSKLHYSSIWGYGENFVILFNAAGNLLAVYTNDEIEYWMSIIGDNEIPHVLSNLKNLSQMISPLAHNFKIDPNELIINDDEEMGRYNAIVF